MLKKRLSLIFCLVFIFIAVGPLETASAGTSWEKWFSTGTVETRPARYISVYSAELVGYADWNNRHGGADLVLSTHFKYIDLTDSSQGWQSLTVTPVPTRGGEYAEEIRGLTPGHTYQFYTYVKMTSSGSHEDSAHCQTFTTLGGNGSPWSSYSSDGVVATSQASGISKYEAVLRGHVEWQNRHGMIDLVRDAHFKYIDLTDSSQGWQSVTVTPVPSGGGDYSVRLKGLAPGHTYEYYTYLNMTVSGGHEDSAHKQKFTTEQGTGSTWSAYSSSGIVATIAAENVTQYSADLKGHVEWQNRNGMIDLVRDVHFKYQDLTDTSKGWQSVTITPVPSGGGDFTANLKGLTPGHDYQFYAYLNMTVSGAHDDSAHTRTFSTLPGNGTSWEEYSSNGVVATLEALNVTQYGADLKGYVKWQNRHGMIDLVKGAHFWYTDNTNKYAGERTVKVTSVPSNGGYFTAHLSGLVPGHTYMFYACVDMTLSGSHNNVKNMQSFTTQPGEVSSWQPPSVNSGGDSDGVLATLPVTNVGPYSADLNCHVEWQNKSNIIFEKDYIIELGFYYSDGVITGKTTSAPFKSCSLPLHTSGGDYSVHLKGLQPGHTYTCYPYVEMIGTDSKWMSAAKRITFTTLSGTGTPWSDNSSIGIISTLPADKVTDSSAVLHGHVEWQNQHYLKNLVREAGFRYQDITSGEKDWKTKKLILPPTSGGDFSATISGLTKGHAYRFYPYAAMTMGGTYEDSLHAFIFTAGSGKKLDIKANLPTGVVGSGYSGTLTASGGDGNYTWNGTITAWDSSIAKGDGLYIYPNGSVSGVPKAATPTSPQSVPLQVWVTVTDGSGNTGSASFTIDVIEQLRVTTTSLPSSRTKVFYQTSDGKTVTLAGAGGKGPYTWSGTITPPNGLILNADGSITGIPQAAVTSTVNVVLKDSTGRTVTASLSIPVFDELKITTASLPGGVAGSSYQTPDGKPVRLAAAGGDGKYTWSGTITPANGLNFTPDGTITGAPLAPIESTINATVSDGSGNKANGSFKITVYDKLQITTAMLPGGLIGAAYQTSDGKAVILSATGGDGKYTWNGTITPSNGTLKVTADGKITGTPNASAGNPPLTVTAEVKDRSGNSARASFKLLINAPLPAGTVGQLYNVDLAGSGGDGKYTWSGTITPTNGTLKVTADGKITGTPDAATGNKPLTVQALVRDGSGNAGGISLCLSVLDKTARPLTITTTGLPEAAAGQSYSASLAASGGDGRYTWSGTITPPNGLTLNSGGSITGTPRSAVASTVNATVADNSGNSAKAQFTIRPKGIITLSLAETTIDMDNNSQLKCFFTVSPADAIVSASSDKTGTASCVLGGSAGSYWLTLTAGNPTSYYDTVATITVSASKPGFTGTTRSFNIRVPFKAPEKKVVNDGGDSVIRTAPRLTTVNAAPGTVIGSTRLTLGFEGAASYAVCILGDVFTVPNVGDIPSGAGTYNPGDNITGVTAGMRLGIYALDNKGRVMAFSDHVLTAPEVAAAAPPIESFEVLPVIDDRVTAITDLSHTGASSFAVIVQNDPFNTPLIGDPPPGGAVSYTAGTGINNVDPGQHLGIFALDLSGKIIAFSDITLEAFVRVTNITGVPAAATAGTNLTLTGTVEPGNSTNKDIVWSIKDAGGTNATINENIFSAPVSGNVIVTATIENGVAPGTNYTQDFTITVT